MGDKRYLVMLISQDATRARPAGTTRPSGAAAVRIVRGMNAEPDDAGSPFPRSLTGREAETLEFMLSAAFPGDEVLREQASRAVVIEQCTCGCATIDLGLERDAPVAPEIQGAPLIQTRARDMDEHSVALMLFVRDGRLSSLEIVWYDESQITGEFPAPDFWEAPIASTGYDAHAGAADGDGDADADADAQP